MTVIDQPRLDKHLHNIETTVLADLRTLADNGGRMGVFLLALPIIDTLARAASTDLKYWERYTEIYMPRLRPAAPFIHDEFRKPPAHRLSANSRLRLTTGEDTRWAHATTIRSSDGTEHLYLHAGELANDVIAGFDLVRDETRLNPALHRRILRELERNPPAGDSPRPRPPSTRG
jgi:hypothetical protein